MAEAMQMHLALVSAAATQQPAENCSPAAKPNQGPSSGFATAGGTCMHSRSSPIDSLMQHCRGDVGHSKYAEVRQQQGLDAQTLQQEGGTARQQMQSGVELGKFKADCGEPKADSGDSKADGGEREADVGEPKADGGEPKVGVADHFMHGVTDDLHRQQSLSSKRKRALSEDVPEETAGKDRVHHCRCLSEMVLQDSQTSIAATSVLGGSRLHLVLAAVYVTLHLKMLCCRDPLRSCPCLSQHCHITHLQVQHFHDETTQE